MKKQTAVEWFIEELEKHMNITGNIVLYNYIIKHAKELEKKETTDFADEYANAILGGCTFTSVDLYNEKFKIQ